ncbi:MAG TPA: methylmalonyl-CoA mutase family protein [Pseudonocardiaceae bacterium]|jgi:methylmalonyl-CoA mutase|nr:methylmalonyl-CoA mutase family protein [Pseudonocardiaceae bacterium]
MTTPPDQLDLAAEFPGVTRQDWRELVRAVLVRSGVAGAETASAPEDLLAAQSYDGIPIAPLYTRGDGPGSVTGLPGLTPFTRGGRPEGATLGGWDVRARHAEPDPADANPALLADLEHGVSSLWLAVGTGGIPVDGLATALADVLLDLAPITLDPGADFAAAAEALLAVHADRGLPVDAVGGNLGFDPIGLAARTGAAPDLAEAAALAAKYAAGHPNLRTMVVDGSPYHEAGGSDAQELGCALAAGVAYLRALTDAGLDVTAAAGQLEFRIAVGPDQFAGIAKLRAARRIWARVAEVSGVRGPAAAQRQHAVTSPAMLTRRDPWVNILRGTLACFAAGVGGADAVTVLPFDDAIGRPNGFSRRVARNTQSVLLEESRLAGVIDPAGGSWFVESLTDSLAQQAWAVFTEIERAGGLPAELANGGVADRLAATRSARAANIATRTDPITGVSEFPNLAEPRLDRAPRPDRPETGGLPRIRYAQDFEELRDRSDAVRADTGHRPAVFLATLGPVAAHTARAGFAANLLQAGGIDTPTAGATADVAELVAAFTTSGLAVACLCGTDRSYAEQAEAAVAALKKAGARTVLLAGPAGTGGADDFLYRGCDALAVLHRTWDTLEAR